MVHLLYLLDAPTSSTTLFLTCCNVGRTPRPLQAANAAQAAIISITEKPGAQPSPAKAPPSFLGHPQSAHPALSELSWRFE